MNSEATAIEKLRATRMRNPPVNVGRIAGMTTLLYTVNLSAPIDWAARIISGDTLFTAWKTSTARTTAHESDINRIWPPFPVPNQRMKKGIAAIAGTGRRLSTTGSNSENNDLLELISKPKIRPNSEPTKKPHRALPSVAAAWMRIPGYVSRKASKTWAGPGRNSSEDKCNPL